MFNMTDIVSAQTSNITTFGGSQSDYGYGIFATNDGGFVVVGASNSNDGHLAGLNKGKHDATIAKYSRNGILQWVKTFGGSENDVFETATTTADGGYIVVGRSFSNDGDMQDISKGNYDAITVRFDHNGSWDYMPNDPSDPNPVDGDDGDGQSNGLAPKLQCSGSVCNILPSMNKANKNHFILANKKESVDISTLIPRNYAVIIALWD